MASWAIQDPDLEVYYAVQQYNHGSVTVASEHGSSAYTPMTFPNEKAAKDYIKQKADHDSAFRKTKWKAVEIWKEN